jgi:hypothetical protein
MFEVLSVENTDENCEFNSFALVFGSPLPQPDIVNPSVIGIYVDYLDGNKGHSTNIAKQEKRKTGTDIANYRNRPQKECKSSYNGCLLRLYHDRLILEVVSICLPVMGG